MRPGSRLLLLLLCWAALSLLPVLAAAFASGWRDSALLIWVLAGLALALWAVLDARRLSARPAPAAERSLPAALSVGVPQTITLRLSGGRPGEIWNLADHHPDDDSHTGLPREVTLAADITEVRYRYRPSRRGPVAFGDIEVWLPSPARLWQDRRRVAAARTVPVYPDFSPIARAALAVDKSQLRFGNRQQPRRGQGLEFHELREYQPGDSPRRIDWKASARRRHLITRHYQDEQNQSLWVLLDAGRRMKLPVGDLTLFDHGLNATLLLAWSALRQGDRVGSLLFSRDTPRWLSPVHGPSGIQTLLKGFYDVHPQEHASDFSQAARYFHGRWQRRSLVVLVSRLHPEDSDDLLAAVTLLSRRHLVMVADIRLPEQEALHQAPVQDLDDALRLAADAQEQEHRRALHVRLRRAGANVVAATPERLAERLGQTYLALKRAGRL